MSLTKTYKNTKERPSKKERKERRQAWRVQTMSANIQKPLLQKKIPKLEKRN
jgi:hypothetical protein